MSGEPQPGGGQDKLDAAVFALKAVWFGLFSGGLVLTVTAIAVVFSGDGPMVDLGELAYLFLLPVPLGLFGAFVLAPMLAPKDPATLIRSTTSRPSMYESWKDTTPDDPYFWLPAYGAGFMLRAAMLEGTAILCAIGFMITANWVVLGGALLLIAALVTQIPTRSAVEAFAADARQRQAGM